MEKIDVLDHGFVRLVDHMGDDLAIVRDARQSYDAAWRTGEDEGSDTRLLRYLVKHNHSTPIEGVVFKFEIHAPIMVMRQWQRHRTWPFWTINELSARYKELPAEFYIPDAAVIGEQSTINKQGRQGVEDEVLRRKRDTQIAVYRAACEGGFEAYKALLLAGWPRELARNVLPLATYTNLFGKVDLHNLLHFLELRLDAHAQWEIRQYAEAILELIQPIVPVCVAAWAYSQPGEKSQ